MLDLIVLHGEFSLFTVRGNFWYQIYRNRRKKVLCSRLSLITLTIRYCVLVLGSGRSGIIIVYFFILVLFSCSTGNCKQKICCFILLLLED